VTGGGQTGGIGGCVRDVVPTCRRSLMLREGSKIRALVGAVATAAGPVATAAGRVATWAWVVVAVVMARECWRLPEIWFLKGRHRPQFDLTMAAAVLAAMV
jgi:hypothetical protein